MLTVEECRKSLKYYVEKTDYLMDLVNKPSSLSPDKINEARENLKSLKSSLDLDIKRQKSNIPLNAPEQAVYFPALMQARADLLISAATRPNSEWYSNLYHIQVTLSYALSQLADWDKD